MSHYILTAIQLNLQCTLLVIWILDLLCVTINCTHIYISARCGGGWKKVGNETRKKYFVFKNLIGILSRYSAIKIKSEETSTGNIAKNVQGSISSTVLHPMPNFYVIYQVGVSLFFFLGGTFHYMFQTRHTLYLWLHRYQWKKLPKPHEVFLVKPLQRVFDWILFKANKVFTNPSCQ